MGANDLGDKQALARREAGVAGALLADGEPDPALPEERRAWIKWALAVDVLLVLLMWVLLTLGSAGEGSLPVNWRVTIGAALMLVAFVTFAGFYLASPPDAPARDPWMRNAIAATFVVFYLVLLTLLLTGPNFRIEVAGTARVPDRFDPTPDEPRDGGGVDQPAVIDDIPFGEEVFNGYTTFLAVILTFYFGSQAAEKITDTIQAQKTTRAAIAADPAIARQVLTVSRRPTPRTGT
jgi:hypothetical protein